MGRSRDTGKAEQPPLAHQTLKQAFTAALGEPITLDYRGVAMLAFMALWTRDTAHAAWFGLSCTGTLERGSLQLCTQRHS